MMWPTLFAILFLPYVGCSFLPWLCNNFLISHIISRTDLHSSPVPYFRTFKIFLISFQRCASPRHRNKLKTWLYARPKSLTQASYFPSCTTWLTDQVGHMTQVDKGAGHVSQKHVTWLEVNFKSHIPFSLSKAVLPNLFTVLCKAT
jgi:hypothetical protein